MVAPTQSRHARAAAVEPARRNRPPELPPCSHRSCRRTISRLRCRAAGSRPTTDEARDRRAALRRRHQRRRRAARAIHRRAAGRARRRPRADDLRARLRDLAQRVSGRRRRGQRHSRSSASRCRASATSRDFARRSTRVFEPAALAAGRARLARQRRARQPASARAPAAAARRVRLRAALQRRAITTPTTARAPSPDRAVLVPTAEREPALGLAIFQPVFRGVRAIMYNSFEERALIQARGRQRARARASSSASARRFRRSVDAERARQTFGLREPVRRLRRPDRREQGVRRAVRLLHRLRRPAASAPLDLVLDRHAGAADSGASAHPPSRLRQRPGQVRRDRRRRGAGHAVATTRACRWWRSRRGRSAGRCSPTRAATCWSASACAATPACTMRTRAEFAGALDALLDDPALAARARTQRPRRTSTRHYSWPVIERKYLDMFERLTAEPPSARDGAAARLVRTPAPRCCRRPPRSLTHAVRAGPRPVRSREATRVKFAFVTPRYGAEIDDGPGACLPAARRAGQRAARRRRAHHLRARSADVEERVRRGRRTACAACWSGASPSASRTTATRSSSCRDRLSPARTVAADELEWVRRLGPSSPGLHRLLKRQHRTYDALVFFSLLHATTVHGLADRARAQRALSLPAARSGAALRPLAGAAGSARARRLLSRRAERAAGARASCASAGRTRKWSASASSRRRSRPTRGTSRIPADDAVDRRRRAARSREDGRAVDYLTGRGVPFRRRHRLYGPFALYGGRVEPDNGCEEMLEYFDTYAAADGDTRAGADGREDDEGAGERRTCGWPACCPIASG